MMASATNPPDFFLCVVCLQGAINISIWSWNWKKTIETSRRAEWIPIYFIVDVSGQVTGVKDEAQNIAKDKISDYIM